MPVVGDRLVDIISQRIIPFKSKFKSRFPLFSTMTFIEFSTFHFRVSTGHGALETIPELSIKAEPRFACKQMKASP